MFRFSLKFLQKWSISNRLTFTYALSTIFILMMVTLFMYWALLNSLQKENYQFLINEINIIKDLAQNFSDTPSNNKLKQEIIWEPATFQNSGYHYYGRILDSHGHILMQTVGMDKLIISNKFPDFLNTPSIDKNKNSIWAITKHHYYLMATKITIYNTRKKIVLQVAYFSKHQVELMEDYRQALIFVLLLGSFLATFISALIARKSVAPLKQITQTIGLVTTKKLYERIDPALWPEELMALAISFNQMLHRIQEGYEQLVRFSEDLAHELRTPINNLMIATEIGLAKSRSITDYQSLLTANLEEYASLSRTINHLLFLARSDNAQIKLHLTQFEGRSTLIEICEFFEALAQEKNLQFIIEGQALVVADRDLFRQVINNILSNAIYYSSQNHTIIINLSNKESSAVIIRIQDQGIGIAREHLTKIFDRFYRVDVARAQHTGGTGLGLAIAKSIMNLHQGNIEIISQINVGTTVTLIFPINKILTS